MVGRALLTFGGTVRVRDAALPCSLAVNNIGQDGATALAAALEKNATLTSLECVWGKALGLGGGRELKVGGHGGGGERAGCVEEGM